MSETAGSRGFKPSRRALLIGGSAVGVAGVAGAMFLTRTGPGRPGKPVNTKRPPGKPMSMAEIFERVSPAVVSINVTSEVDPRSRRGRPPPGGPGFDDEEGETPDGRPPFVARSSGSGFFVSAEGYVVTNNHVVEDGGEITVALKDGRELPASVVGRDENTDLAVLKVSDPKDKAAKFPFVDFEDSAMPRVGDWVIAIGNPFGLGGTATAGIVSAYGRDIGQGVEFLQIDAPINRGNSGGPSFDVYGRVIGVNTAIYSPSGGSVGIGFAVPADLAAEVARQLRSGAPIVRGYIGAGVETLTPELAREGDFGTDRGVVVGELSPGGPAERSGLQQGDVVVAIGGERVVTALQLTRKVAETKPGEVIRLDVVRRGRRRSVMVRSGTRPAERELAGSRRRRPARPDGEGGG
jgi:serine protease Do